ncbi:MAG: rhizopine-binding protein [Rhodovulum sulfidophilum]|uniref:Rhizopine-binding protein n=1 Tax=Rhodovulum sulfidophilum TaxID=35806 RepID=A0A2W5Q4Z6_RHOSU|nr:MAG: rhizopine-binding protein [Rhodovulum sulfidophilum]
MRKLILASILGACATMPASAQTIGVSLPNFDNTFQTLIKNAMSDYASTLPGVSLQLEDAQLDIGRQLSQVQNFIASGVDGIIISVVDSDATTAMTNAAKEAGVPLVYVNTGPSDPHSLPEGQAFVASNELDSGTLETQEICRQLKAKGKGDGAKAVILIGDLSNEAARLRTQDVHDVVATPDCSFIEIVDEQTATWQRTLASDLVTNWLSAGTEFDAVISNNDEMAIGAIQALKAAGVSMDDVVIGGIDATADGLAAMQAGDLDVTVFQDAAGQGRGSVDAVLKLIKGEKLDQQIYIPFELVTPANMDKYLNIN